MSRKTRIERALVAVAPVKEHRLPRVPVLARPYVSWEVGVARELLKQCSIDFGFRKQQRRQLPRSVRFVKTKLVARGEGYGVRQMIARLRPSWRDGGWEGKGNEEGK